MVFGGGYCSVVSREALKMKIRLFWIEVVREIVWTSLNLLLQGKSNQGCSVWSLQVQLQHLPCRLVHTYASPIRKIITHPRINYTPTNLLQKVSQIFSSHFALHKLHSHRAQKNWKHFLCWGFANSWCFGSKSQENILLRDSLAHLNN
jgi:hypothetical protein